MARKSKKNKFLQSRKSLAATVAVVLILIGMFNPDVRDRAAEMLEPVFPGISSPYKPLDSKVKGPLTEGLWDVIHVVDGDTFDVADSDGNKYRVRLIGADTPETVKPNTPVQPFGPEASAFTKKKIAEAKNRVRLAFDGDEVDKYGRSLAMVYLQMPTGEEVWLNELLIREGLARAQVQYRFSKGAKTAFQQAEAEAKRAKRNLWSQ
ncbi:MAG: thermonuclease family protein [Planctomycetaceae bacterium]|jgi:micrococcal nuclease|nr:thermonuclease family protein [Planctomycetaceae bacterium]